MKKYTVKIDGMVCGMCEAHVCDAVRNTFPEAKKVAASRRRGEVTFICGDIDESLLADAVSKTGYTVISLSSEEK